jgi:Domain of unknown function (DUF1844)
VSAREPGDPAGQPTEEELRAALEEQMKRIRVEDIIVQTVVTLVNLAGRRLGLGLSPEEQAEEKDPDQARQAIEAVRALAPLLPEDAAAPIRDALAQLQMAYAREARAAPAGEPAARGPEGGEEAPRRQEDAERAKARSKIWTPPGT